MKTEIRALLREIMPLSQARVARRLARRAEAARDGRQFGVAAMLYEEALRLNPDNARMRVQCGHMLKEAGDLAGAEEQFNEVVAQAHGRRLTPIVLTHGGLARLALARGDLATAAAESNAAIDMFEHVDGFRNVRTGPYLWLIRAEALRRSGDNGRAREWAQRALDASRHYDDPSAASIRNAQAAVQATGRG